MPMESVVELMRKDIQVEIPKRDKEKNYFTISYVGKDPKVVAQVTNKLSSLFIEENLKIREQQAQGTTEFLESELSSKKDKVEKFQQEITDFKRRYINELPENRDANLQVLDAAQSPEPENQRSHQGRRGPQDHYSKPTGQYDLSKFRLRDRRQGFCFDAQTPDGRPDEPVERASGGTAGQIYGEPPRYRGDQKEDRRSGKEAGRSPGGGPRDGGPKKGRMRIP